MKNNQMLTLLPVFVVRSFNVASYNRCFHVLHAIACHGMHRLTHAVCMHMEHVRQLLSLLHNYKSNKTLRHKIFQSMADFNMTC